MIVYHGTDSYSAQNIIENGINLSYGDESVDNARGFYTTPSKEFATQRAKMVTASSKKFREDDTLKPVILQIEISDSAFSSLNIKEFDGCAYDWKEFVLYNRLGKRFLRNQSIVSDNHNLDFKYDVVIDETADAGVSKIVSSIRYKETRNNTDISSEIKKIQKSDNIFWGKQISFHTYRALQKCIISKEIIEI